MTLKHNEVAKIIDLKGSRRKTPVALVFAVRLLVVAVGIAVYGLVVGIIG